jgi:Sensors of blue-light using FAD
MHSLTYFSIETQSFSEQDLETLLEHCVTKNTRLGITGMLLYKRGIFLQAIEGPDQALQDLYSTIRSDPRHNHVTQVDARPIDHREFGEWQMGFRNLDQQVADVLPGFIEFANPFSDNEFLMDSNHAHKLLLHFAKNA